MTLQIFLHFFHHKFVTSLQSTSLPPATSAPAYGASEMRYSPQPDRASGHVFSYPPTASGAHASPQMRRGRAAAEAPLLSIYSGTALRCISPSPLYPRTRCPGKSRI